jgi:predicted DNA-binding transcriptional regulator AlpA
MPKHTGLAAPEPETITLAAVCRIIGISVPTATKLLKASPTDFPAVFWIGRRRRVLRRNVETWLARKMGEGMSSVA